MTELFDVFPLPSFGCVFGVGCDHVSVDGLAALAAGLHDNNSLRTVDLSCEWRCEIVYTTALHP